MLKLELELSNLDYESLLEVILPLAGDKLNNEALGAMLGSGASSAMAKAALRMMPQEKKDRMTAELINRNADKICTAIESAAAKNGVFCRIRTVSAEVEG